MRKSNDFITALALSGDVLNTMNGGVSQPRIKFTPSEDCQLVEVKVPGVEAHKLNIEVNHNRLMIFQGVSRGVEVMVPVPRIIFDKPIPYYIDVEKITAEVEDNVLYVKLPFNARANGYHRRIGITS
jgi:HSP20 family molecular chaperone IbpA